MTENSPAVNINNNHENIELFLHWPGYLYGKYMYPGV